MNIDNNVVTYVAQMALADFKSNTLSVNGGAKVYHLAGG